jgi:hypothetical protein
MVFWVRNKVFRPADTVFRLPCDVFRPAKTVFGPAETMLRFPCVMRRAPVHSPSREELAARGNRIVFWGRLDLLRLPARLLRRPPGGFHLRIFDQVGHHRQPRRLEHLETRRLGHA